MAKDLVPCWVL